LRSRPRPGLPLVRLPSPSEFLSPTGSAFVAPGAPPSPFRPAWGLSHRADSRDARFRETLSWSSAPLQSSTACTPPALLLRPVRRPPKKTATGAFRECGIRLFWFLLPRTQRRRVPRSPRCAETPRGGRGIADPPPVPSSGFLPLSTVSGCTSRRSVLLAEHAVGRDAPTLGGLVPCRSRSWSRPSELFPLGEPCPLSRVLASVRVRVRPLPGATCSRDSRPLSPSRRLLASAHPRGFTGLRSRDDGSSRPLRRSVARAAKRADRDRHTSCTPGSPVGGRHARFEALLPP